MSLTVENLTFEKTKFRPVVTIDGRSLKIGTTPYEHPSGNGTVEATSIDFSADDAGKLFYLSLVRRKGQGQVSASYHLIVQSPAVMRPMVPELDTTIDVLFTFAVGNVKSDGSTIDATVRLYSY